MDDVTSNKAAVCEIPRGDKQTTFEDGDLSVSQNYGGNVPNVTDTHVARKTRKKKIRSRKSKRTPHLPASSR